jgi:FlaA1/EpsC-like NDP-sugar epimerase
MNFGLQTLHPSLLLPVAGSGFFAIVLTRLMARQLFIPAEFVPKRERVAIYGAGLAGAQLAASLAINYRQWRLVAFIDDDVCLHERTVCGVRVYPSTALTELRDRIGFSRVLLAKPSQSAEQHRDILEMLGTLSVRVSVMPSLDDLASGQKRITDLRDVQLEDLLPRNAVLPDPDLLSALVTDKSVLVTGAGGSIGAELCRQVMALGAKRLVLLELSEYALFKINLELQQQALPNPPELVSILGDVTTPGLAEALIKRYEIETVYHAAAYKHVAMAETNTVVTVRNNVVGTLNAVRAAEAGGASNFVLISTDKAVSPTSIMGSSKRVCEMIVQSIAARTPDMRMSIVRFGNVLASSGSVVPLFLEQIAKGGPVTVTHPEVTRYFMTIPEAAQLVIQAGAIGKRGETLLLDMGEPVRILEVAERLISLSGLTVRKPGVAGGDIEIRITGLGSGEKLHEILMTGQEKLPTAHPKIYKINEPVPTWEALRLEELAAALDENCALKVRNVLRNIVGHQLAPSIVAESSKWQPQVLPSQSRVSANLH